MEQTPIYNKGHQPRSIKMVKKMK